MKHSEYLQTREKIQAETKCAAIRVLCERHSIDKECFITAPIPRKGLITWIERQCREVVYPGMGRSGCADFEMMIRFADSIEGEGLGGGVQTLVITDKQPLKVDPRLKVAGMEIELISIEGSDD